MSPFPSRADWGNKARLQVEFGAAPLDADESHPAPSVPNSLCRMLADLEEKGLAVLTEDGKTILAKRYEDEKEPSKA